MKRGFAPGLKPRALFLVGAILCLLSLFSSTLGAQPQGQVGVETVRARVLEAGKVVPGEGVVQGAQQVKLEILSGEYRGRIVTTENRFSGHPAYDMPVKPGDKVLVNLEKHPNGSLEVFITDYVRQDHIFWLLAIFILSLISVGGFKGLKAVFTLTVTVVIIFKCLLPLMLKGYNPIPMTIAAAFFIAVVTLFTISGINKKALAAVMGTTGGVILAGLLSYVVGYKVKLTGLSSEEAAMLLFIPQRVNFDFKALLFAGILLGALGAVMDVCISIAAAMEEVHENNPHLSRKDLWTAGMNVGRDVMGTMISTLILAYTGSSIPLLLLLMAYGVDFSKIVNLDTIATEIVRSLSGSIGMVLSVPLTALAASFLFKGSCS